MDEVLANMVKCLQTEPASDRAAAVAGGSDPQMQAVLTALYTDADPDIAALREMGERLDRVMRTPPEVMPPVTTLLNEAVRQNNIRWTRALLKAGADPNASGSVMAYSALKVFHPGSPVVHMFNDGSPATAFLQAYIDHGGQVNTAGGGGTGNTPLLNYTSRNLAARVFLLENGADPWFSPHPPSRLRYDSSALASLIWGARAPYNAEQIALLGKRGFLRPPDNELYQEMTRDTVLGHLEHYGAASGPTERHKLWQLQQAVRALIEARVVAPDPAILELLERHSVPDTEGGWILREGALWQPHDDPRMGSVLGTEVW